MGRLNHRASSIGESMTLTRAIRGDSISVGMARRDSSGPLLVPNPSRASMTSFGANAVSRSRKMSVAATNQLKDLSVNPESGMGAAPNVLTHQNVSGFAWAIECAS